MAKSNTARAVASRPSTDPQPMRLVKAAPVPEKKPEKDLSGVYRIIHGSFTGPRPRSETHNDDGTRKENVELNQEFGAGAEVYLNHEDAKRALRACTVEEISANPSRVGKVYEPSAPHDNSKQAIAQRQQHIPRALLAAAD